MDAWATYIQKHGSSGIAPVSQVPAQVRGATGPTEQRILEHDNKLQQLEQQLQNVTQKQEEHTNELKQVKTDLVQSEQRMAHSFQQAMTSMKQELSASFTEALKTQTSHFEKPVLRMAQTMVNPKRKEPTDGDDDMSSG